MSKRKVEVIFDDDDTFSLGVPVASSSANQLSPRRTRRTSQRSPDSASKRPLGTAPPTVIKPSGDLQVAPRSPSTRDLRLPYYSSAARSLATSRNGILRQGGWVDGVSNATRDRVTKRMRTRLVKSGDVPADSSAYPTPRARRDTIPQSHKAPLPSSSQNPPTEPVSTTPPSAGRALRSRAKSASQPTLDVHQEERRTHLTRRTASELQIQTNDAPKAPPNAPSNVAASSSASQKMDTATTAVEPERPERTYARSQQAGNAPDQTVILPSPSKLVFSRPRTTADYPDPRPPRTAAPPSRELLASESTLHPPGHVKRDIEVRNEYAALDIETRQLMDEYEKVMAEQRALKEKLQARIKKEKEYNAQLRRLLKDV